MDGLKARHEKEDEHWAIANRIPKDDARAIRIAAGITDSAKVMIANLDSNTLRQRGHILLVESIGCIRLHVLKHDGKAFKEIWTLTGIQDRGWTIDAISDSPGPGICNNAPKPPSAHATPDGRIAVEIPSLTDPFQRSVPVTTHSFAWNGSKYVLQPAP